MGIEQYGLNLIAAVSPFSGMHWNASLTEHSQALTLSTLLTSSVSLGAWSVLCFCLIFFRLRRNEGEARAELETDNFAPQSPAGSSQPSRRRDRFTAACAAR